MTVLNHQDWHLVGIRLFIEQKQNLFSLDEVIPGPVCIEEKN